jgi:hypothetical protein
MKMFPDLLDLKAALFARKLICNSIIGIIA